MGTIENKPRTGRPDESVKSPEVAALLRNQLAPDSPSDVKWKLPPTESSYEANKGSVPSGRQALSAPLSAHPDDKRTSGTAGNAGPM